MMAKENLAEMPENYDMMDEVKASAVMNETEEQKIVASNVNDNQEGENPPSPKGGAATKAVEENTVNENARDISQPLTVEDIVKSKQLSPEMLAEIINAAKNDNLFPVDNLDGKELTDKINELHEWVNAEESKQFYYAADFILKAKPKYFVFENVPGFVDARPKIAHDILKNKDGKIRCIGQYLRDVLGEEYHLNFGIYTAADYGCVEDRSRLIILGCRKDISTEPWKFPKKHSVRKMLWEVIGDLMSLGNGEIDPNDPWHYARELSENIIKILAHTPTGCSAWDNEAEYQPLTDSGEYSNGNYGKGFTRNEWQDQCPTITTGNGSISDVYSLHPGRYNPETQEYTDCRVFSLRELLKIMDCPNEFFDKLNLKREENGMLNETEENNLRKAIGQHFCPLHVNALYSTLPLPANDNNKPDDNAD